MFQEIIFDKKFHSFHKNAQDAKRRGQFENFEHTSEINI